MERWYLCCHRTGKNHALKAQKILAYLGIMVFSPMFHSYRCRSDRQGKKRAVIEQLFPGYLFIYFNPLIHPISEIENCPGISRFVRFGNELATVSKDVVYELINSSILTENNFIKKHLSLGNIFTETSKHQKILSIINEKDCFKRNAIFCDFIKSLN